MLSWKNFVKNFKYRTNTEGMETTEKLFLENEIRTNMIGSLCMLGLSVVCALFGILICSGFTGTYFEWTGWILIGECAAALLMYFIIRHIGYDDRNSKFIVLAGMILIGCAAYFLYPVSSVFLIFGPALMSIKYYDPRLTVKVTCISWVAFILAVAANVMLEYMSPEIHALHVEQGVEEIWMAVWYVVLYYVLPRTAVFAIEGFLGYSIAKAGRRLVIEQAEVSTEAALMSSDLNTASRIQNASLPDTQFITPDKRMELAAYMKTARDVGGDFYDYFMINDHLTVVTVADVSDKGLPAAMYAVEAQSYVRFAFSESFHKDINGDVEYIDLERAVNALNRQLSIHNMDGMFVTMWIGCFDTRTGTGKFINAGHDLPYIRHADGTVETVENEPQFFLGAFKDAELSAVPMRLRSGDTLILYTDGATDARNAADETFGEERLKKAAAEADAEKGETVPAGMIRSITSGIEKHIGEEPQYDDITLLALHFRGEFHSNKTDITLETGEECASRVMDFVNAGLKSCSCNEKFRRKIDVMIDEICSNISEYAYDGEKGRLKVEMHIGSNFISMRFEDDGPEFDPLKAEVPDISGEPQIGGLGIYLMKNLADGVAYRYEDGKNILTVYSIWNM